MSKDKVNIPREQRYFSEAARRQVVKEIDNKVYSKAEAARVYNVSQACIYKWIKQYSLNYKQRTFAVESESESIKTKDTAAQVKDLKASIQQNTIENVFYQHLIEIINKEYDLGFDLPKNLGNMTAEDLERIKALLDKRKSS